MQYMLLFYSAPADLERKKNDAASADHWESWRAYMGAIHSAGIVKGGKALASPEVATTIRLRDGQRQVHDGPYADTKEMLGGFLIIDVGSLDEAMVWAARSPSCNSGSTEIRPIDESPL
jgi:hypothetical protein